MPTASASKRDELAALATLEVDAVTLLAAGYTSEGTSLLRAMTGNKDFAFPKPLSLIKALIAQAADPQNGDIVLDFFAGSGTTGQAVLELNAEDEGDRRFILVSTSETTSKTPDRNVCKDITAKRLQAAIAGYSVPTKTGVKKVEGLGGDFAYLRARRIILETLHAEIQHGQMRSPCAA